MYAEDNLLPISALQHLVFCERQVALIHLERVWADSAATIEGRFLHERTDEGSRETRGDLRVVRNLTIRSLRLGIAGRADAVEFHRLRNGEAGGRVLDGRRGTWMAFPVEYKRGRPKKHRADEVQLCAQALCLEEMLVSSIPRGALFYGRTRRRHDVAFDEALRRITEEATARLRTILSGKRTPVATWEEKCETCSLLSLCLPKSVGSSTAQYMQDVFKAGLPAPGDS